MLRERYFLPEWPLAGKHGFDEFRLYAPARQADTLGFGGCDNQQGGVEKGMPASFEEEGNVGQKAHVSLSAFSEETLPAQTDGRMEDRFQTVPLLRVGENHLPEGTTVERLILLWPRQAELASDCRSDFIVGRQEVMHAGIRVEDNAINPLGQ